MCVTDFQQLLKLEPGNKQALNELQKLQMVCVKIQSLAQNDEVVIEEEKQLNNESKALAPLASDVFIGLEIFLLSL